MFLQSEGGFSWFPTSWFQTPDERERDTNHINWLIALEKKVLRCIVIGLKDMLRQSVITDVTIRRYHRVWIQLLEEWVYAFVWELIVWNGGTKFERPVGASTLGADAPLFTLLSNMPKDEQQYKHCYSIHEDYIKFHHNYENFGDGKNWNAISMV